MNGVLVYRLVMQSLQNVSNFHEDFPVVGRSWKASAQAQQLPVENLQQMMLSAAASWLKRVAYHDVLKADAERWPGVLAMLNAQGFTQADIEDVLETVRAVSASLQASPPETYEQIIAISDQLIATFPTIPSLWPE